MELEDDLLSLPHNVLVKIQYGGLLGLLHFISDNQDNTVGDIATLVSEVKLQFNSPEAIPLDSVNKVIIDLICFKAADAGETRHKSLSPPGLKLTQSIKYHKTV